MSEAQPPAEVVPDGGEAATRVAGLSVLKGLVLYAAILAFAGIYTYFIVEIFSASAGKPPAIDSALISAAAALAGVFGSAFALEVGRSSGAGPTNEGLANALQASSAGRLKGAQTQLRRILSLEPAASTSSSWPKTFGIWVYAVVGSAVAITYVLNQSETPGPVKALGVAFGGYVIALVTAAYGADKA